MNSMDDFPWNEKGLVKEVYNRDNYLIEHTGKKTGRVIIFFSSNALYYPNDEKEMYEKIVRQDYYEWSNLAKHKKIKDYYEKIIYVRDIYKQWYITGINSRLDSIDKLLGFLKKECEGYEITTCGSSSGGYIAALVGTLIEAKRVFTNSGQFSIEHTIPYREYYAADRDRNKYFNIVSLIQNRANYIYYFYPADVEQDKDQYELVKHISLKVFSFKSNEHGVTMYASVFPFLLTMSNEKLDDVYKDYLNSYIVPQDFYEKIVPFEDRIMISSKRVVKKGVKKLKVFKKMQEKNKSIGKEPRFR